LIEKVQSYEIQDKLSLYTEIYKLKLEIYIRKIKFVQHSSTGQREYFKSGDPFAMGYFDNLDNRSLNKYKKKLKWKKVYRCILLFLD
jgi:hypothetical protein